MDFNTTMNYAKSGEFSKVLSALESVLSTPEDPLNLFIAICNGCYSNPETCEYFLLESLCNKLIIHISVLQKEHQTVYCQSLYHIVKVLSNKEKYEDIWKLQNVITPNFIDEHIVQEVTKAKQAYLAVIQVITKLLNGLFKSKQYKYIFKLLMVLLRATNKSQSSNRFLLYAQKCCYMLNESKAKPEELWQFYVCVMKELSVNSDYNNTENLKLLLTVYSSIVCIVIQRNDFEFCLKFMSATENQIKSLFPCKEFQIGHFLFKFVKYLMPKNISMLKKTLQSFSKSFQEHSVLNEELFYEVLLLLSQPMEMIIKHSNEHSKWCNQMSEEDFQTFLDFFLEFVNYSHKLCSFNQSECEKYKVFIAKLGTSIISLLCVDIVETKLNLSKQSIVQINKCLRSIFNIIKELKSNKYKNWKEMYQNLVRNTFNVHCALNKAKNEFHRIIAICFIKNYNSEVLNSCFPKNILETVFGLLCYWEYTNQNFLQCMGLAALYRLVFEEGSDSFYLDWWVKAKKKLSITPVYTMVDVLELDVLQPLLKETIDFEQKLKRKINKTQLLLFEMRCYKAVWKSKNALLTCFNQLVKVADIYNLVNTVIEIYGEGNIPITSLMLPVCKNAIKLIEKHSGNEGIKITGYEDIGLAILYFYKYKASSQLCAEKNLEEMNAMKDSAQCNSNPILVPKDANDVCDIVSSYSNLQLNTYIDILKSLDRCKNILAKVPIESLSLEHLQILSKLLLAMGFEYRLNCLSLASTHSFHLSMTYAQRASDKEGQLLALSFLLEASNLKNTETEELLKCGDKLVNILKKEDVGKYKRTAPIYYMSKAKVLLYDNEREAYEAWKVSNALCTASEDRPMFQMLQSELLIILHKLSNNCDLIEGEHEREPMTLKLHEAYDTASSISKTSFSLSPYDRCILLDTAYELGKVYKLMRLPRDLRAYTRQTLTLTQKSAIPLRCVQFLLLLAYSDVVTNRVDDCNVKLNGIDDIFDLTNFIEPVLEQSYASKLNNSPTNDVECGSIVESMRNLSIDAHQFDKQYRPSSPTLKIDGFRQPQFLEHESNCLCFMCVNVEFQQMQLQQYHAKAKLYAAQGEYCIAVDFLKGAIHLYERLNETFSGFKRKISVWIPDYIHPKFRDVFLETYAGIVYDLCNIMNNNPNLKLTQSKLSALHFNTLLVKVLKPEKFRYAYLYKEALMQRLAFTVTKNEISKQNKYQTQEENIIPKGSLFKTPSKQMSSVTVTTNDINIPSPPKGKFKKRKLFTETVGLNVEKISQKKDGQNDTRELFVLPKTKGKNLAIPSILPPPKIKIFNDDDDETVEKSNIKNKRILKEPVQKSDRKKKETSNSEGSSSSNATKSIRKSTRKKAL
ncbi:hypothetical protein ABEB36_009916 [Hypothenemus hampei]|uniref:Protein three rows n=1 Tax=Hypothenemus hampei TaxID=57062 RepID=A0ABD1EHW6_HYPHA